MGEQYLRDKEIFSVPKLFSSIGIHSSAPKYHKYFQLWRECHLAISCSITHIGFNMETDPGFYLGSDPYIANAYTDPGQTLPSPKVELLNEKYTSYGIRS